VRNRIASVFAILAAALVLISLTLYGIETSQESEVSSFLGLLNLGANYECSNGWLVTGYFTPVESDYEGERVKVTVVDPQGTESQRVFYKTFLEDVTIEAFGKSLNGDYIGTFSSGEEWHSRTNDVDAVGDDLIAGKTIAVDPDLISIGTKITIATLPEPWARYSYVASDEGGGVQGKHIDVFTGEGEEAKQRTTKITGKNNTVCIL
jgi:3D (Asp-Asp-Asp) domain-containing protein